MTATRAEIDERVREIMARRKLRRTRTYRAPSREATPRQLEILATLERLYRDRGYPPTLRELCRETGIGTTNGIMCHLKALERKGMIRRAFGMSRTWTPAYPEGCCRCCGRPMEEGA